MKFGLGFSLALLSEVSRLLYRLKRLHNEVPEVRVDLNSERFFDSALHSALIWTHSVPLETPEDPLDALNCYKVQLHAYQCESFDTAEASHSDNDISSLFSFKK